MRVWWGVGDPDKERWRPALVRWCLVHDFDPDEVFAVERLGYRHVRVHAYALDDQGRKHVHPNQPGMVALAEPVEFRW